MASITERQERLFNTLQNLDRSQQFEFVCPEDAENRLKYVIRTILKMRIPDANLTGAIQEKICDRTFETVKNLYRVVMPVELFYQIVEDATLICYQQIED